MAIQETEADYNYNKLIGLLITNWHNIVYWHDAYMYIPVMPMIPKTYRKIIQCHHSCAADWQRSQFDYLRSAGNWFPVGGLPVLSVRLWDDNSHLPMAKWQQLMQDYWELVMSAHVLEGNLTCTLLLSDFSYYSVLPLSLTRHIAMVTNVLWHDYNGFSLSVNSHSESSWS